MAAARDEQHEAQFDGEDGIELSSCSGEVHARPIYLGSGYSEFPCGIDGNASVLVAAFPEEVTCTACKKDQAERIARASKPQRDLAADRLAAGLGYTHAPARSRDHRGYVLPCGVYVGREQYGAEGEPVTITTQPGDTINCPGCRSAEKDRELVRDMNALTAALLGSTWNPEEARRFTVVNGELVDTYAMGGDQ